MEGQKNVETKILDEKKMAEAQGKDNTTPNEFTVWWNMEQGCPPCVPRPRRRRKRWAYLHGDAE